MSAPERLSSNFAVLIRVTMLFSPFAGSDPRFLLRRSILASSTAFLVSVASSCQARDLERHHAFSSAVGAAEQNIGSVDNTWPMPAPIGLDAYAHWALW